MNNAVGVDLSHSWHIVMVKPENPPLSHIVYRVRPKAKRGEAKWNKDPNTPI